MKKVIFIALCLVSSYGLAMENEQSATDEGRKTQQECEESRVKTKYPRFLTKEQLEFGKNYAKFEKERVSSESKSKPFMPFLFLYTGPMYAQYCLKQGFRNWTRTVAKRTKDTEQEIHFLS